MRKNGRLISIHHQASLGGAALWPFSAPAGCIKKSCALRAQDFYIHRWRRKRQEGSTSQRRRGALSTGALRTRKSLQNKKKKVSRGVPPVNLEKSGKVRGFEKGLAGGDCDGRVFYGAGAETLIFVTGTSGKDNQKIFVSRQKNQSQLWVPRKPRNQARKRHINISLFVRLVLGRPGFVPGISPGLSPGQTR